jgi:hypothetical protein
VQPSLSRQQLIHLLEVGHESEQLDYKQECDLSNRKAAMEIAKDVAAMQVEGGHIVVGADDHGNPVPPGLSPEHQKLFDEATLRPKLAKWLPESFELRTAVHELDDCTFAIIYVAPSADGFCVFKDDGKYSDGGRDRFVFRKGEVFARHGTSSERWRQSDIDRIRQNMAASLKEQWRADLREDLTQLGIAHGAQRLIEGPAANFTWRLDTATFESATLELLRRNDDIPLQRFLNELAADAAPLVEGREWDELTTLVGRAISLAAQAITYQRRKWLNLALDAMSNIYRLGFDPSGYQRNDGKSEDLWLIVVEHLLALGALAVRKGDWEAVRAITVRPPGGSDDYYPTWLRHGLTMGARANKFGSGQNTKSLITMAAERAGSLPALRPDVSVEDERLTTSLCQFDILAAITIIGATGEVDTRGWYANFARFYTSRAEPVVKRLLEDPSMRAVIFPRSDEDLAAALREIDRMATNEGSRFSGWYGFDNATVGDFLAKHPP